MDRIDVTPHAGLDLQVGLLLAMLDDVTNEWRSELGGVPDEAVVWQPFPGGHSIGMLILHMADVEVHWLHQVGAGQSRSPEELHSFLSEETQQYQVQWPTPPAQPLTWYFARQDAVRAQTSRLIAATADPEHLSVRGENEFSLRWLLHHTLTHEAYHGGQAVLLALIQQKSTTLPAGPTA